MHANKVSKRIVFIATGWGAKYGGINAFNEDLCVATSELLSQKYEVFSVVLEATKKEIASARSKGLQIISLGAGRGRDSFDHKDIPRILSKLASSGGGEVAWWVGHDVITGPIAIEASHGAYRSKSAVIHHMDYDAYESYKDVDSDRTRQKIEHQREILSSADIVFAVGPKLANSARSCLARTAVPAFSEQACDFAILRRT